MSGRHPLRRVADGPPEVPVIGVSSCLIGRRVRFDGGHKRDAFVVDTLGPHVRFLPVCPEVEYGLGTPRETLRLVRQGTTVRLVMRSGEDHTDGMASFARARVAALADEQLDGYILKRDSPSCGFERVKVFEGKGPGMREGRGLFAAELLARWPSLPVEDEGRLCDPALRENFIERVFAYRRLKTLFAARWSFGDLVAFHTVHKYTLLAHSTVAYGELGRLVARARTLARATLRDRYSSEFMTALAVPATRRRHTNVLQHMLGHLRDRLDQVGRDDLAASIEDYRLGSLPLVVPVTLVRHHARRLEVSYLANQVYLEPHPRELALRNHV